MPEFMRSWSPVYRYRFERECLENEAAGRTPEVTFQLIARLAEFRGLSDEQIMRGMWYYGTAPSSIPKRLPDPLPLYWRPKRPNEKRRYR